MKAASGEGNVNAARHVYTRLHPPPGQISTCHNQRSVPDRVLTLARTLTHVHTLARILAVALVMTLVHGHGASTACGSKLHGCASGHAFSTLQR